MKHNGRKDGTKTANKFKIMTKKKKKEGLFQRSDDKYEKEIWGGVRESVRENKELSLEEKLKI